MAIENERLKELAFEGKRYFDCNAAAAMPRHRNTNPDWVRWLLQAANY